MMGAALSTLKTTAKTLVGAINEIFEKLTTHTGSTNNPHGVTASQTGAYTTAQTDSAISSHNTSTTAHADIRSIINNCVGLPTYNSSTHVITFTDKSGATVSIDLPLEGLAQNLEYDAATKEIVLIKQNGTKTRISVSDLIDVYTGSTGTHIQITVSGGNVISAVLRAGTVSETELTAALLSKINGKQAALNRTVVGNDNATAAVTDNGGNLSIPVPVTVAAPVASATQITAGTRTLRATLKILIDNIANLFSRLGTAETNIANKLNTSAMGAANGVAGLGADGKVPAAQLPTSATGVTSVMPNTAGGRAGVEGLVIAGNQIGLAPSRISSREFPIGTSLLGRILYIQGNLRPAWYESLLNLTVGPAGSISSNWGSGGGQLSAQVNSPINGGGFYLAGEWRITSHVSDSGITGNSSRICTIARVS